ncbi:kinase-like domain-containing protein [Schizophyllum amplum]|uniref:Kinase-like domain-containing protein n=1 Tax=Schizophyllum amplum TaxID=97359 RepID=A0A550CMC7_9AGAR|nr:kinase-like domain-containing protein [Auriculariopsis ampla]
MRSPAVSRRRIATSMRSTSAPKRPSATRPAGARPRPSSRSLSANVCARLVTEKDEVKEFINLTMSSNKPVLIGRNPRLCNYLLTEFHVSGIHCKLYAVKAPTGGLLVSCQDLSRNGIMVNGDHFKRTSVILMDGDELSIPGSQTFKCLHVWKEPHEKTTLFDPTQPSQRDSNKVKLKTMNQYVVTSKSLGSGAFATVHLAIDPSNHRQVACKTICARRKKDKQQVLSEVEMLKRLRHPNINEVYDCVESDKHFVNIFLQLCTGGDLFTYITEHSLRGRLICEAETKYIMYQVFRGVKYLHDSFISHRDLKPENIFLHSPGAYPRIMIGDFGLARPNADQATFNVVGTVSYLPPEGVLALDRKELSYIGLPSDCWSAGVILYIMLTGCHPFDNERSEPSERWMDHIQESHEVENSQQPSQQYLRGEARLKAKIARGNVEFSHEWLDFPAAQELVSDLLIMDPGQRATVDEALTSDWIASQADVLEQMYRERVSMDDDASKKMPTAPAPPV